MPMLGSDVHFCSYLAATLRISVIDADYRKAPEHVFPACVEGEFVIGSCPHCLSHS
jgi:acetyl esterase/lipase